MPDPAEAARLLLDVRRSGVPIGGLGAGVAPATLEQAYAIQDAIIARTSPVAGWKLTGVSGAQMLSSPLPGTLIFENGAHVPGSGGLPVVTAEVEIGVRLGKDLPPRATPYTAADVHDAIASLHPMIELISLSWIDKGKVDRLSQTANLQSSAGLVVGPALSDWQPFEAESATAELRLDGRQAATAASGASLKDMIEGLAWLANHAAARQMPLAAAHVVTMGARVLAPTDGVKLIEGEIAGLGQVSVTVA